MGGDGGSIPGRADVVKVRGYGFARKLGSMGYAPNTLIRDSEHQDANAARELRLTLCGITQSSLAPPIVVDKLGVPYNKDAILERLMTKVSLPDTVKRLRDLCELSNDSSCAAFPAFNASTKQMQCQLSGAPCLGRLGSSPFFVSWPCGCLFSTAAAKETNTFAERESVCPVCRGEVTHSREVLPVAQIDRRSKEAPHSSKTQGDTPY